jgi:phosphoribosyl-dephospho-CoA transferase
MYKRHDLVWLKPEGWQAALAARPEHAPVFEHWQRENWPAVVRRRDPGSDGEREVSLGIALPPDADGGKPRVAFSAPLEHVERSTPPLTLKAARGALRPQWRAGYAELERLAAGLDLHVYGSLAWEALTSLPCMTDSSDIDLLLRPVSEQQLHAGLALLGSPAHGLPLDGEIMFPSGQAVSWKEWGNASMASARVLVKDADTVRLVVPNELLATLRPT